MSRKVLTSISIICLISVSFILFPIIAKNNPSFESTTPSFTLPYTLETQKARYATPVGRSIASQDAFKVSRSSDPVPYWKDLVDAEQVSNNGEGVYVAVLDTGLLSSWTHYLPKDRIATDLGTGFTHNLYWNDTTRTIEAGSLTKTDFITDKASGHGTHVVSTILGYQLGETWISGIAPKATVIPVKVLDAWEIETPSGSVRYTGGMPDMIATGINYIADLARTLDKPVIISMSLGALTPSPLIEDAIDYAIESGVIVVAAAGNAGEAGMDWPGAYPEVISCGMGGWTEQFVDGGDFWLRDVPEKLNTKDSWGNNWQIFLSPMSSRPNKKLGQKPFALDVTTLGSAILGPYKPTFSEDVGYWFLWGTSMATPHVSGIAALVAQSYPQIDQATMQHILKTAAHGLPLPCDGSWAYMLPEMKYHFDWSGTDYGSGFLQADAALQSAWRNSKGK